MKQRIPTPALNSLQKLVEGNRRFVNGLRSIESRSSPGELKQLAIGGQSPMAILLTCSDSRIPTEMIFDRGIGDLFVIRVAGNIVTPSALASIEYAAISFGTPLCLVMGHSECGAVNAATNHYLNGDPLPSRHLESLIKKITPAVRASQKRHQPDNAGDLCRIANLRNIQRQASLLTQKSELLSNLVANQKLTIASAQFDLHTGKVNFNLTSSSMKETSKVAKEYESSARAVADI